MKNFKVNLAIVALLLGSSVAFATTTKQLDPTHYKDPVTGEWKLLEANEGEGEGEYTCEDDNSICTGYFSIQNPDMDDVPESNARPGVYTPH